MRVPLNSRNSILNYGPRWSLPPIFKIRTKSVVQGTPHYTLKFWTDSAVLGSLHPFFKIRTDSAVHGSLSPLLEVFTKLAVRGSLLCTYAFLLKNLVCVLKIDGPSSYRPVSFIHQKLRDLIQNKAFLVNMNSDHFRVHLD